MEKQLSECKNLRCRAVELIKMQGLETEEDWGKNTRTWDTFLKILTYFNLSGMFL